MKIELDTSNLSTLDIQVLNLLFTGQAPPAEPEPKPVKKAAPPKAEPKAAEPSPPPSEEPEAPTLADAVAAATQLVSTGGAAKVKAALAVVGSKRVSEVAPENIAAFLAALES